MNYILIITDGMRADFALDPSLMPNVHAFLIQYGGMKFANAYSPSTWTTAVLMSLYTGQLPSNNGLDDITYATPEQAMEKDEKYWRADKCQDADFFIALLREKGYYTKLFTVDRFCKILASTVYHHFGECISWDFRYFQLNKIKAVSHEDPFFFHMYDQDGGHDPFGEYPRTTLEDWMKWKETHQPVTYLSVWKDPKNWDRNRLYKCCKAQIKQYDKKLGKFFQWLVESRLYENTVVILTSDHGSCLREHNWVGHVQNCYEEIIRVPLFVYSPGMARLQTVSDIVSTVDIAPTVLGVDRFGDGINLFRREKDRAVFFEFTRDKDPAGNKQEALADSKYPKTSFIRGVRHQSFKYIYSRTVKDEVIRELYDLSKGHVEDGDSLVHSESYEKKYLTVLKETFGEQGF